jgi:hypothetical protein
LKPASASPDGSPDKEVSSSLNPTAPLPPAVFDANGNPVQLANNVVFHPAGSVATGESPDQSQMQAVYGSDGEPIGFIQVLPETAAGESRNGQLFRAGAGRVVPASTVWAPPATIRPSIFDPQGHPIAVSTFIADDVNLQVITEDGSVTRRFFDASGKEIFITGFAQKVKFNGSGAVVAETTFKDRDGNPVDVSALFDASGHPLKFERFIADPVTNGYFVDDLGARLDRFFDGSGNEISVTDVFDETRPVFSSQPGAPVFAPPAAFDEKPPEASPDNDVCDSLSPEQTAPVYFDEQGHAVDLSYRSRVALFDFCDVEGKLSQRKVVFDENGTPVGFMLLQAEPEHPTVTFCPFPKGRDVTQFIEEVPLNEPVRNPWQKSGSLKGASMTWPGRELGDLTAVPKLSQPAGASTGPAVYDLGQMKQIAYTTAKKGKLAGVKPLGDIGLAVRVVKPLGPVKH